jgi:hypothetical protein
MAKSKGKSRSRSSRGSRKSQMMAYAPAPPVASSAASPASKYGIGYSIFLVVLFVAVITIHVLALLWLQKLETTSCKCSVNWKRDYIKYFLYAYFIFVGLQLLSYAVTGKQLVESQSGLVKALVMLFNLFATINAFVAIFYVNELKQADCKCSDDVRREVYYYWNVVYLALWALVILLTIIMMIYLAILFASFR